jgi:hypothetical protein
MSEHGATEDDDIIDPGIFTRLRPFARWLFVAIMILGIAWAVFSWR